MKTILSLCAIVGMFFTGCSAPAPGPPSQGQIRIQADGVTANLSRSKTPTLCNVEKINSIVEPAIHQPVSVSADEELTVSGWAVDRAAKSGPSGVEVVVDGKAYRARSGMDRHDVADYHKEPGYIKSGFTFSAPAEAFGKGKHQIAVRVILKDGTSYFETPALALHVE